MQSRTWWSISAQDLIERFGWRSPGERLSGSAVESCSDCVELSQRVPADIRTFWEVLLQQIVCLFVRSTLPRILRITK